jgi:phosphatidylglycerol:prolipoprotein diacylglycerol transferase
VEFVREPDAHLGSVLLNWMSMGQALCIPMIILGLYLLYRPERTAKGDIPVESRKKV